MSRNKYDEFVKTLPKDVCLFCDYKKYQIVIREWKYWVLIQPISPYFKNHTMLCSKRHVKYLNELNDKERSEFWKIDKKLNKAYESAGIKRIRMQLQIRYLGKKFNVNDHLHIHYYEFKEGDFRIIVSKTAYKQDMKKLLKNKLK